MANAKIIIIITSLMIYSLQSFRGIAAILVVLSHVIDVMRPYFDESPHYVAFWGFGKGGVQFFFVLSGFIIYHVHRLEQNRSDRLQIYAKKRIVRVVPLYWAINLAMAPFWLYVPGWGEPYHKSFGNLVTSMLFIQQSHAPNLHVGWTLNHEMLFYVIFLSFFLLKRFAPIAIGWAGLIAVYNLFFHESHWMTDFLFNTNNLLFLAGVGIAYYWKKLDVLIEGIGGFALFLLGILIFTVGGFLFYEGVLGRDRGFVLFYGVGAVCLVAGAKSKKIESFFSRRKLMLFIGDASYSIYLSHVLILSVAAKVISKLQGFVALPNWLVWIALIVISLIGGCICYLVVEKPLLNFFRKKLLPKPAATASA